MKAALLSKAALCICPPAMLATTAAYVPPVRSAVHHATRPPAKAAPKAQPKRTAAGVAAVPCTPALLTPPIVPQTTFAVPVPSDAVSGPAFFGAVPAPGVAIGGINPGGVGGGNAGGGGGGGGGGDTGTTPPGGGTVETPAPPAVAVPEPSTWSMMLLGFGLLGAALRSRPQPKQRSSGKQRAGGKRRRRPALAGGMLLGALEPVQAMTSSVGAGSKMTLLAKAAMCVCPPALVVATVATVPQARKAVYAATMPRTAPATIAVPPPCDPVVPSVATI